MGRKRKTGKGLLEILYIRRFEEPYLRKIWVVCRYQKINSAFDEINNLLIFITVNRTIWSRSSFHTELIEDIIHFTILGECVYGVFIVIKLVC